MIESIDLTKPANQSVFARLVGVSQPAINKQVEKGVLPRDANYGVWIKSYTEHLREQAAGRGGDVQATLTLARIEESKENTASKRQDRLAKAGDLVVRDEAGQVISEMGSIVQMSFMNTGEKIIERIESKYSIKLKDDDVYKPIRDTLGYIADRTKQLGRIIRGSSESDDSSASDANRGVEPV